MMKVLATLVFFLAFLGWCLDWASKEILPIEQTLTPVAIKNEIVDQEIIIETLYPRPMVSQHSFNTPGGRMDLIFNDTGRYVQIYTDTDHLQPVYLPYPEHLDNSRGVSITRAPDTTIFALCTTKGFFVIAPEFDQFDLVDPVNCQPQIAAGSTLFEISPSPDGRFFAYFPVLENKAYRRETRFYDTTKQKIAPIDQVSKKLKSWLPYWSPDWASYVEVLYIGGYTNSIVVKHQKTNEITEPIYIAWERVEIERWLNQEHLLLRGHYPYNNTAMIDELFLLSTKSQELISLGKHITEGCVFFDDFTKLARIQLRDGLSTDPYLCNLNILDLTTRLSEDVETTFCRQPSDLTVSESLQSLVYLHSEIPSSEAPLQSTPTLRLVALDDFSIEELPIESVNAIHSVSPDERYLILIIDHPNSPQRNIYYWLKWINPLVVIFDLQRNQVVFEQPILPESIPVISWSSQGNAFVLNAGTNSDPHVYLITLNPVKKHFLPDISNNYQRFNQSYLSRSNQWSPSGAQLLFFTEKQAQVFVLADQTIVPITNLLKTSELALNVEWYGDSDLLLVEIIPAQEEIVSKRWVIDPSLALQP